MSYNKKVDRSQEQIVGALRDVGATWVPIAVRIPMLPPTVNHMYVALKHNKKALSDEAVGFRKEVWANLMETPDRPTLPDGPLSLTMRLTFGDRRRTDLDNRLKAAIDAVAVALRFDDARIRRIVAEHIGVNPGRPFCEIVIEPCEEIK